jgi:hypothetical protein
LGFIVREEHTDHDILADEAHALHHRVGELDVKIERDRIVARGQRGAWDPESSVEDILGDHPLAFP